MTRQLVLLLIRIYWLLPGKWKRGCLFKVSCSRHIYAEIQVHGLNAGIKQLLIRRRQCRPGYGMYVTEDKKEWVVLSDGSIVERAETTL